MQEDADCLARLGDKRRRHINATWVLPIKTCQDEPIREFASGYKEKRLFYIHVCSALGHFVSERFLLETVAHVKQIQR